MRNRLKAVRSTLNLTQAEFAKTIGLTRATIASYEGGYLDVSERTINDICRVHNINEKWYKNKYLKKSSILTKLYVWLFRKKFFLICKISLILKK